MNSFNFFGHTIQAYGLLGVAGVLAGLLVLLFRIRRFKMSFDDAAYLLVFSTLFAIAGAKILYLITAIPELIDVFSGSAPTIVSLFNRFVAGGFVYYGGAIGAAIGLYYMSRWFKIDTGKAFAVVTPVLPLVHSFGRIGCHMVGCCYGKVTTGPIYHVYTHSDIAPLGLHLIPIQLIESGLEFIIFIVMLFYTSRKKEKAYSFEVYLLLYAPIRFVLEFFRGDSIRGVFWGISTSQIISVALLIYAICSISIRKKHLKNLKQ